MLKKCNTCGKAKSTTDFYKSNRDGLQSKCKDCTKASWWTNKNGYIVGRIWIDGKRVFIRKHRYIMEFHIGRKLTKNENVHQQTKALIKKLEEIKDDIRCNGFFACPGSDLKNIMTMRTCVNCAAVIKLKRIIAKLKGV